MTILHIISGLLQALYLIAVAGMAAYGYHCLMNIILYLRVRNRRSNTAGAAMFSVWPPVTVQLPIFNERYTSEPLIRSVAALDYPRDQLQIQVLDDSTDDTHELIGRLVDEYRSRGINIEMIHRVDRSGYKAGALQNGLKTAAGEFIAIFDADFLPDPTWLKKSLGGFCDPGIGCLQTRWGHQNRNFNLLTRGVALGIDAHFMIEQTARARNGLMMNFNGTAGIWRKACIEDAGGWEADTLTEDLDLSYRAQLKGWRIAYLPDIVVPAELPIEVQAFKRQQFRWAKGNFQVIRKLMPKLILSSQPLHRKLMGVLHLSGYFVHPLMLLMLLLLLPIGLLAPEMMRAYPWALAASFGPPLMILLARTEQMPRWIDRLKIVPISLIIGFGLSFSNTLGVLQGLFSKKTGAFARTPKLSVNGRNRNYANHVYKIPLNKEVVYEIGLGIYALCSAVILGPKIGWGILPLCFLYSAGFFYMAALSICQTRKTSRCLEPYLTAAGR